MPHETNPLNSFHIVLVEPFDNLNIGSVARAMMNLGFTNLHLVAPPAFDPDAAGRTARWAVDILTGAKIHNTLEEALVPMQDVVGFAAGSGRNRRLHLMLPEWVSQISAAQPPQTALLFGTERTGLRREHLEQCRSIVRIPSTEEYPSFNLAQSVLLVMYELARLRWQEMPAPPKYPPAAWNEICQLDKKIETLLAECGFYREDSSQASRGIIKNLFRRTQADEREIGLLLAMFDHILGALRRKAP